ncbi:MAG TPA: arginine--tRNA ligase [Bacteroidia bacterium]|nr:arginine--tRNA ligase [Bacteroidia bacterium]HRB96903.1 arginine--tRNA ligase [Nitrosomonas sp.]MBP7715220.1 arginine--tRNA ligase [Bacteroidia bacterium]MBP8668581.1 arginine--tRNA ligase [Bacteroidia bacterium]HOZ81431.1 arginine--tRNA ligase [Bacteroidia bacterium]
MIFEQELASITNEALKVLFNFEPDESLLTYTQTRKEFDGDYTIVVFPFVRQSKKSPEETGRLIGEYLIKHASFISNYNVIKGFLNITVSDEQWLKRIAVAFADSEYGFTKADKSKPVIVEYASPNTNKPIHLGHLRNILLGYSVSLLLKATGRNVKRVSIINDRGVHICKSMLAWKKFGNDETPQSSGMKGDHLVGKYYVEFDKQYKQQVSEMISAGIEKDKAEKNAPLMQEVRQMLIEWEQGNEEVTALWKKMNGWVYEGFDVTYNRLGVDFDKTYYESETYLLGKKIVEEGLSKGVFYKKADNSVWVDLTNDGLDEKIVQRSDGTSVYITQDLGTAVLRHDEFDFDSKIYVVGNEQDYHFKVLFLILKKLGYEWAEKLYHLSYAMVDLPSGKMKSREGTVVDADDLMDEVTAAAAEETSKLGKVEEFSSDELKQLYETLGFGALKYFILKVDPEKRMLFNPAESVEIHGNTGPYIQYVHARICSVLKRASQMEQLSNYKNTAIESLVSMNEKERELAINILRFKETVETAAEKFSPAIVANYVYELAKNFNQFYHDNSIISEGELETSQFRLCLADACAMTIKKSLNLLGIKAPERM